MSTPVDEPAGLSKTLEAMSRIACWRLGIPPVDQARIASALNQAVDVDLLVGSLAEIWGTSEEQVAELFREFGLEGLLAHRAAEFSDRQIAGVQAEVSDPQDHLWREWGSGQVRVKCLHPGLVSGGAPLSAAVEAFCGGVASDPYVGLYRQGVGEYHAEFVRNQGPQIRQFVSDRFGAEGPRYLINSGIGANEQSNHLLSALNNADPSRKLEWYPVHSVKQMAQVPAEACVENTLFMEFSRSGVTEETVKLHEYTPRRAQRIVFANTGPLCELGRRDGNLVLELPTEVSGRFGRNKTPILLAPMLVAGLDTTSYWDTIERLCEAESLAEEDSLPVRLAAYIRARQLASGINHIYLATNSPLLLHSADEFCQFWNEGLNKGDNDMLMSRYLGLPRDSHMNLEGILANCRTKLAVFLIHTGPGCGGGGHPLLERRIDPINPAHANLSADEHDLVLTLANLQRCSELMPTVVVAVREIDLTASALLGQLWADLAFVYSRLVHVDPGSNPEVKAVRRRGSAWLADKDAALRLLE